MCAFCQNGIVINQAKFGKTSAVSILSMLNAVVPLAHAELPSSLPSI
jgi:hypothetical protein